MTATVPPPPVPTRRRARRTHLGLVVFAVVCVGFLAFSLPPYLSADYTQARLPPRADYPLHYPLLWAHIMFGSVALLAACLQIWPWLRRAHPRVHRWSGRLYLFGGVLPGSIVVLGVTPVSSSGPISAVGNTVLALLWFGTAVAGWRAARARRFRDHRAWMLRSVALTFSIVVNRVWIGVFVGLFAAFGFPLDTPTIMAASGAAVWTSWVVNLLVVEWFVLRPRRTAPESGDGLRPEPIARERAHRRLTRRAPVAR